jgi:Zn-dependent protease
MDLPQLILTAMAALVALTIHEFAHGYVAYKLGDDTAKSLGRLSLNPIKHIDPFGAICMVLFHFGWAKPVPINPRNFKNPRRGFALSALAGPATNLIVGFFTAFLYLLFYSIFRETGNAFIDSFEINILLFLLYFFSINIGLGIFNLIPIPPFDGSRILYVALPQKWYFKVMKYERQIYWGVIAWLLLGRYVYAALISVPFIANNSALSVLAKIFSLSDILSDAINAIANGMLNFWRLIPMFR